MRQRRVRCLGGSGWGQNVPCRVLTPMLNGKKGCGGAGLKDLGRRGRRLQLEKGNHGHPLISPACRGLFSRGGTRARAGWAEWGLRLLCLKKCCDGLWWREKGERGAGEMLLAAKPQDPSWSRRREKEQYDQYGFIVEPRLPRRETICSLSMHHLLVWPVGWATRGRGD